MLKSCHCKHGSDGVHKFYQHLGKHYSSLLFFQVYLSLQSNLVFYRFFCFSYLHSCTPPIIHGNLTCDTIFIQHNGLVKIGSVAPDAINHHVKTCRDNIKNMHFIAPEYGCKLHS